MAGSWAAIRRGGGGAVHPTRHYKKSLRMGGIIRFIVWFGLKISNYSLLLNCILRIDIQLTFNVYVSNWSKDVFVVHLFDSPAIYSLLIYRNVP